MKPVDTFKQRLRAYPWPPAVRRYGPPGALLLIGLLLGALLFGSEAEADDDAHTHADHAGVEQWTCSMHPQVRQREPGACPICGMDLIPATSPDEIATEPRYLTVSESAAALMDVQVWPVERRDVERDVRLFGRIAYDETTVRDVILRAEGQIEVLHVPYVNAPVRAGQPLAEVYSPAMQAAAREFLQARRAGDDQLLDAAREQLQTLGLEDAQIGAIAAEGTAPRTFTLRSPASGIVAELVARHGDWVSAGGRVLRVAGTDQLWAQFDAYESDLTHLRVGQLVRFDIEAFPGQTFTGRIAYIDPSFEDDRRTVRVRVNISNPTGRLRPGMFIRGEAGATQSLDSAPLVIPASAPLLTGERALVYVRVPGTDVPTFEPRDVVLGSRARDFYVVHDGLAEGELVVTHGAFKIDSELQIRGRRSMMTPSDGAHELPHIDHASYRVPADAGRSLEQVASAYLTLATSMAGEDSESARAAARNALRSVDRVDLAGAAPGALETWLRVSAQMRDALQHIADAGDLDAMRRPLQMLTRHVETMLRSFESDAFGEYFLAFCPMAFEDEGATWIQSERAIANPYFGSQMLTCGEIRGRVAADAPPPSSASPSSSSSAVHTH